MIGFYCVTNVTVLQMLLCYKCYCVSNVAAAAKFIVYTIHFGDLLSWNLTKHKMMIIFLLQV